MPEKTNSDARSDARREGRAKAFPELVSLVKGLVSAAAGSDAPAVASARRWLGAHCPGCGAEKSERRDACDDCRRAWRETSAVGRPTP